MGRKVGERALGWGTHVYLWLIHVNVWQKLSQYCKVMILQLKIKLKLKKLAIAHFSLLLACKILQASKESQILSSFSFPRPSFTKSNCSSKMVLLSDFLFLDDDLRAWHYIVKLQ